MCSEVQIVTSFLQEHNGFRDDSLAMPCGVEDCPAEPNYCLEDGFDCVIGLKAIFVEERRVILIARDFVVEKSEVKEGELFDGNFVVA